MKYRELKMYCMVFSNLMKYKKLNVWAVAPNPFFGREVLFAVDGWPH